MNKENTAIRWNINKKPVETLFILYPEAFEKVSKKRKIYALSELSKWVAQELTKLN